MKQTPLRSLVLAYASGYQVRSHLPLDQKKAVPGYRTPKLLTLDHHSKEINTWQRNKKQQQRNRKRAPISG